MPTRLLVHTEERQDGNSYRVLATWREEYVTWVFYNDDLKTTAHGNYFMWAHTSEAEAFENAKADFLKRVTRYI